MKTVADCGDSGYYACMKSCVGNAWPLGPYLPLGPPWVRVVASAGAIVVCTAHCTEQVCCVGDKRSSEIGW